MLQVGRADGPRERDVVHRQEQRAALGDAAQRADRQREGRLLSLGWIAPTDGPEQLRQPLHLQLVLRLVPAHELARRRLHVLPGPPECAEEAVDALHEVPAVGDALVAQDEEAPLLRQLPRDVPQQGALADARVPVQQQDPARAALGFRHQGRDPVEVPLAPPERRARRLPGGHGAVDGLGGALGERAPEPRPVPLGQGRRGGERPERLARIGGEGEAVLGLAREQLEHHLPQPRVDLRAPPVPRPERLLPGLGEHHRHGWPREREPAAEHAVEQHPDRVQVQPRPRERLAEGLLRRHVRRRPEHDVVGRQPRGGVRRHRGRDAEVRDLQDQLAGGVPGDQQVLGLDVPVQHLPRVHVRQRSQGLGRQAADHRRRQLRVEQPGQGHAVEQLHGQEAAGTLRPPAAEVQDPHDVGVVDAGGEAGLAQEAGAGVVVGAVRVQELQRDPVAAVDPLGLEDGAHAAPAQDLGEAPGAVDVDTDQLLERVSHRSRPRAGSGRRPSPSPARSRPGCRRRAARPASGRFAAPGPCPRSGG